MKEISKYWVSKFDWRKHEKEINKFPNFITQSSMILIFILFMKKEADLNRCLCSLVMDGLEL